MFIANLDIAGHFVAFRNTALTKILRVMFVIVITRIRGSLALGIAILDDLAHLEQKGDVSLEAELELSGRILVIYREKNVKSNTWTSMETWDREQ